MKQTFDVTGMTCAACSARVSKAANGVDGVEEAVVNLLKNSMEVDFDGNPETIAAISAAVTKAGYGAIPRYAGSTSGTTATAAAAAESGSAAKIAAAKQMRMRLVASIVFCVPLFYLAMGHMAHWPMPIDFEQPQNLFAYAFTQFLLVVPIVFLNRSYFQKGFTSLLHRNPNMDSLVGLGAAASLAYSIYGMYAMGQALGAGNHDAAMHAAMNLYFDSAGMILTLITVGKYFEAHAKGKTTSAVESLVNLAPKTAVVLRGGIETEVPIADVREGDVLAVKAGATVPTDGVVLEGAGSVDESAITGESIPVDKTAGSEVTGATVNRSGWFTMQATRVGDDTALAQIVKLVDDATSTKAPIERIADRIAGVFVPAVIGIALVTLAIWTLAGTPAQAINHAITVLVISCPCALGLATPTAIMVGAGRGATHGILVKSAETLETAHALKVVVFDKTGTITTGKPQVVSMFPAEGTEEETLLETATVIENRSEHPLARAICEYAGNAGKTPDAHEIRLFEQIPGEGLRAEIDGKRCLAGNARMMVNNGISLGDLEAKAEQLATEGATPLFFARNGKPLGIIALSDVPKPDSKNALAELAAMGIETVMLTGDNQRTAKAIQRQVGADSVIADVLPQDKERKIAELANRGSVAMVGDGINDAPALARANVGIAVGSGTDVAIESADAVLVRSNLMDVPAMIQLSRATMRNIKQNLFWALFYNAICIPVAMGALAPLGMTLNPMIAAAAMSCSSVCVVSNALRLRRWKPKFTTDSNDTGQWGAIDFAQAAPSIDADRGAQANEAQPKLEPPKPDPDLSQPVIPHDPVIAIREYGVDGMHCMKCVGRVTATLQALDGVERAEVSLDGASARVFFSKQIGPHVVLNAISELGFKPTAPQEPAIVGEKTFSVNGMHCIKCVKRASQALAELPGVASVHVDLEGCRATVKLSKEVPAEMLYETVNALGFEAGPLP